MADNELLDKGHWMKFHPKLLHDVTARLTDPRRLIVYDVFNENGWTGQPVPHTKIDLFFSEIPNYQDEIATLVKGGILSQNENGDIYLPFVINAHQSTRDSLDKRRSAGRKGGLKSSRNKVSSSASSNAQADKDKDKDKDNKIISDTNVSSSFPAPENDGIDADLSELPDSEHGNHEPAAISGKVELVEPELIEQLPDDQTSPRKALLKSQDTAIVEAVAARWQEMAKTCQIPGIRIPITPTRQKTLLSTMKKLDLSLDQVLQIIDILPKSDFLAGRNSNGWKADFSWFIKTENLNKVIDGKYHNEKSDGNNDGVATRLIDRYLKEKNKTDQE